MSRWSRSESLHRQMVRLVQQGRVRVLDSPGVTYSRRRGGLNRPNALAAPAFVHARGFAPNGCLRAMELGPAESQSQRASKRFITASADRRRCLSLVGCPDDLVSSIFSDCIIVPIRGQFPANIFKSPPSCWRESFDRSSGWRSSGRALVEHQRYRQSINPAF
jgi:hypothetical protein